MTKGTPSTAIKRSTKARKEAMKEASAMQGIALPQGLQQQQQARYIPKMTTGT